MMDKMNGGKWFIMMEILGMTWIRSEGYTAILKSGMR